MKLVSLKTVYSRQNSNDYLIGYVTNASRLKMKLYGNLPAMCHAVQLNTCSEVRKLSTKMSRLAENYCLHRNCGGTPRVGSF